MGGGQKDCRLVPLPCIQSLSFNMGEQEIKMWGKGGVQRSEPLEVPRCIFLRSNANFKSLFNVVELVVTNLAMVYDL